MVIQWKQNVCVASQILSLLLVVGQLATYEIAVNCIDGASNQMAELRTENSTLSVSCDGSRISSQNISWAEVEILISADIVEETTISRLDTPVISSLSFRRSFGSRNLASIVVSGDAFSKLSNLRTLSFDSINFENSVLNLSLSDSITELKIVGSELTDLDIVTTKTPHWTHISLDVTFPTIPAFLRRLKANEDLQIEGLRFKGGANTVLPRDQYALVKDLFARTNVVTNVVFQPKCRKQRGALRHRYLGEAYSSFSPIRILEGHQNTDTGTHLVCFEDDVGAVAETYVQASDIDTMEDIARHKDRGFPLWILLTLLAASCAIGLGLAATVIRLSVQNAYLPHDIDQIRHTPRTRLLRGKASRNFMNAGEIVCALEIDSNDVTITEGTRGDNVQLGEFEGRHIVGKRFRHDLRPKKVLFHLVEQMASLKHENIVSLIGITWPPGKDLTVITEYMEKGSLYAVLQDPDYKLDQDAKLNMCMDIATALCYLHTELSMFIREFTSRAVLVNDAKVTKISIFHCVPVDEVDSMTMKAVSFGTGNIAWSAPEYLVNGTEVDPRSANIYSFGVIMGEIWTRNVPYTSLVDNVGYTLADLDLYGRMHKTEMLVPHENHSSISQTPHGLQDLISLCLSVIPGMRPTADDLIVALRVIKCHL